MWEEKETVRGSGINVVVFSIDIAKAPDAVLKSIIFLHHPCLTNDTTHLDVMQCLVKLVVEYAYLWMAPILAQASIDAHIRGDTVMYIVTRSPFFTPCFLRRFAIWHVLSSSSLEGHPTRVNSTFPNQQLSNVFMLLNIKYNNVTIF